jgi:hypothetical protein
MNIDKIKNTLTSPIFNHISSLNREQLEAQKKALISDMELIKTPGYFAGNCNDLYYVRNVELEFINYRLS